MIVNHCSYHLLSAHCSGDRALVRAVETCVRWLEAWGSALALLPGRRAAGVGDGQIHDRRRLLVWRLLQIVLRVLEYIRL